MKNKRIVISLLIFSFAFLGINGVKADEITCPYVINRASNVNKTTLTYKVTKDASNKLSGKAEIKTEKEDNTNEIILVDLHPEYFVNTEGNLFCADIVNTGQANEISNYIDYDAKTRTVKYRCPGGVQNAEECAKTTEEQFTSSNTYIYHKDRILYFQHRDNLDVTEERLNQLAPGKQRIYFITNSGKMSDLNGEIKANKKSTNKLVQESKYKNFYDEKDKSYYKCGNLTRIPKGVPKFTNLLYKLVKVIVPIILVVMGTSDFLRAVSANDEKSMDETPKRFARRIGAAVLIYFVMTMVQLVIKVIDTDNKSSVLSCAKCFISSEKKCETYNYSFGQADEGTGSEAKSSKEGGGSDAGGETEGGGFR